MTKRKFSVTNDGAFVEPYGVGLSVIHKARPDTHTRLRRPLRPLYGYAARSSASNPLFTNHLGSWRAI